MSIAPGVPRRDVEERGTCRQSHSQPPLSNRRSCRRQQNLQSWRCNPLHRQQRALEPDRLLRSNRRRRRQHINQSPFSTQRCCQSARLSASDHSSTTVFVIRSAVASLRQDSQTEMAIEAQNRSTIAGFCIVMQFCIARLPPAIDITEPVIEESRYHSHSVSTRLHYQRSVLWILRMMMTTACGLEAFHRKHQMGTARFPGCSSKLSTPLRGTASAMRGSSRPCEIGHTQEA
jgi:hypothetical protein